MTEIKKSDASQRTREVLKNEELTIDIKKRLIQTYLKSLVKQDPNLYYAPTVEIARSLHVLIQEHLNRMTVEEQSLLKKLSIKDIEVILSYH